ncbi:MAG: ABC transporter ATP-binding protein [Clostridia bacterium]|nr:ABC transporter ATP-binding protein [Clostridia bacterium]
MAENSIVVKNVTKQFKVYFDKGQSFKERIIFRGRNRHEDRVVLNDISLTIDKGQAVGLVGHNGCGKSTLLKLMTRILYPDKGTIDVKGRVSSLIELGAGFHPDMSGRENIYTNASIFGLSKKEIDSRLNDIIAFSELEEFIDNPVRTYSSGMYMRLAFSVAINVDADVLLIDEILAVGDANFQAKCFAKLKEIKAKGTTIVIVSHSLDQIEAFCDRTIWINEGKIVADGIPRDVHMEYMDFMGQRRNDQKQKEKAKEKEKEKEEDKKRWGNGDAQITDVKVLDEDGNEKDVFHVGSKMRIRVTYKVNKKVEDAVFGIGIFRNDGVYCYGTNTRIDRIDRFDIEEDGVLEIEMPSCDLLPGTYLADLAIECDRGVPVDYYKEAFVFETYSKRGDSGITRIDQIWHMPENIKKQ